MGALGYPVIAIEPVPEHISIIEGSLQMNPAFNINLFQGGVSHIDRNILATLDHESSNWGNSRIKEDKSGSADSGTKLSLYSLDSLLLKRKVAMLKLDCEGCEYAALLG
jgi:FkbM family methyltransferase